MKHKYLIYIFAFTFSYSFGQVGIGTTEPEEMLHVVGNVRVEGTSPDSALALVGADDEGNLTSLVLSSKVRLINNKLQLTTGTTYEIGSKSLKTLTTGSGNNYKLNNLNLDLGDGQANDGKTVILVSEINKNIEVTGIAGGSNGMHIFFYATTSNKVTFHDHTTTTGQLSTDANRLNIQAANEVISGGGVVEFIYDGPTQKWILLSIQD